MATKAQKLAYEAGRHMTTEPPERQSIDACPFPPGSEERAEWLRGFQDAVSETPPPVDLRKRIDDAMKAEDRAG